MRFEGVPGDRGRDLDLVTDVTPESVVVDGNHLLRASAYGSARR